MSGILEDARRARWGNAMISACVRRLSAGLIAWLRFFDKRTGSSFSAFCRRGSFSRAAMARFRFLCSFLSSARILWISKISPWGSPHFFLSSFV